MQFDTISEFFAMGGYGFYVWLSYGVSAFLLFILIINSTYKNKVIKKHILQKQKREQKLRQAAKQQQKQKSTENSSSENDTKEVLS